MSGALPQDTEAYLLFLDMLACPWVDAAFRARIANNYVGSKYPAIKNTATIGSKVKAIVSFAKKRTWFFDWRSERHLEALLMKKELRTPY